MPVDFKTYPVIVFLEGEMFTHSNPGRYPAEDLAAEGLIVVSIHYRLNIFGMLSFAHFSISNSVKQVDNAQLIDK